MWMMVFNAKKIFLTNLQHFELKFRSHRANWWVTDKISFNPFVSVYIRLMSVSYPVNPFLVRWCHVQNFPLDKTDRDIRLMYGRYPLPYGLLGTRALHLLYLSGFYPLMSGGITKWHCSCNTDPSVPIFSPNTLCLMVMVLWKFEQNRTNIFYVTEENLKRWWNDWLTEWWNYRMEDRLKTVYQHKIPFCRGYR